MLGLTKSVVPPLVGSEKLYIMILSVTFVTNKNVFRLNLPLKVIVPAAASNVNVLINLLAFLFFYNFYPNAIAYAIANSFDTPPPPEFVIHCVSVPVEDRTWPEVPRVPPAEIALTSRV